MIRGKKNFLPQTALVFGLALMYKLDEGSLFRHEDDRKIRSLDEEESKAHRDNSEEPDEELVMSDGEDEPSDKVADPLDVVIEETAKENQEAVDDKQETKEKQVEFPDTAFQLKINPNIK